MIDQQFRTPKGISSLGQPVTSSRPCHHYDQPHPSTHQWARDKWFILSHTDGLTGGHWSIDLTCHFDRSMSSWLSRIDLSHNHTHFRALPASSCGGVRNYCKVPRSGFVALSHVHRCLPPSLAAPLETAALCLSPSEGER